MTESQTIDSTTRWWILDPIGHRKAEQEAPRPETTTFFGVEMPVIYTDELIKAGLWCCDICNTEIDTEVNGRAQFVPLMGSYALCQKCLVDNLTPQELIDFASGAWQPKDWSQFACGCTACTDFATKEGRTR